MPSPFVRPTTKKMGPIKLSTPIDAETDLEFLKSLPVTQLHVFPYSERPGTAALKIPYVVDEKEKEIMTV